VAQIQVLQRRPLHGWRSETNSTTSPHSDLVRALRKRETVLSNAAIIDLQWSAENQRRDKQ